jgi:branched-chain amino acid transport system ATP-binding protein
VTEFAIETEALTKRFGGIPAVDSLNIQIAENEVVGIIGPNGAGKTTLFNIIMGFLKPDSGYVRIKGKNITGLAPHEVVDMGVARTFQIVRPFMNMTVQKNIIIPCMSPRSKRLSEGKSVDENAWNVLQAFGLTNFAGTLSKTLPHGELRKLELARALATKPEIILLDEPLAGLSKGEIKSTVGLISKVRDQGMTVVIIEHKLREVMQLSERIIVMDRGRKIAEGAPNEVAKNAIVIEAYIGRGIQSAKDRASDGTL